MKVRYHKVKDIVSAAFPLVKTRDVDVLGRGYAFLSNLNWSGGNKATYVAMSLQTGEVGGSTKSYSQTAPWFQTAEGARVEIPLDVVLVELLQSVGRNFLTIHANPTNLTALIGDQ